MTFYVQFALPYLRKTEGNIINDSSLVAQIAQQGAVTYVATKVSISLRGHHGRDRMVDGFTTTCAISANHH